MSAMEVILLERIEKLGQMGDVVRVKPGFARNFLLPQKKALRATKDNMARFEHQRADLEARNLERRKEAEQVAGKMEGTAIVLVRQASDTGQLYGSVSARDVMEGLAANDMTVERRQVVLDRPIKTLGVHKIRIILHPEVSVSIDVNVARSEAEAEAQANPEAASFFEREELSPEAEAEPQPEAEGLPTA